MDAIPVLSQTKSLFQAIFRDFDGARKTRENFSRQCPGVSQVRSACEWAAGDSKAARETQMECLGFFNAFIDCIPIVGHVKGGIHYACGDREGGDKAMKSASRTVGVMGGATIGFFVGGPVGAAAGGISGGLALDGLTTGIDSAVHEEYRPSGMVLQATNIVKDPKNPGLWFDALAISVFDGWSGFTIGKYGNKVKMYHQNKAEITAKIGKEGHMQAYNTAIDARSHIGQNKSNVPQVISHAKDLKTNKTFTGTNRQLRNKSNKAKDVLKGNSPSNLQKRAPKVEDVLGRDPRACAEHEALHKLLADRPMVKNDEIRITTVRVNKDGTITALGRCDNCLQYDMGSVPTDTIHGMLIVEHPGWINRELFGSVALSAIKQNGAVQDSIREQQMSAYYANQIRFGSGYQAFSSFFPGIPIRPSTNSFPYVYMWIYNYRLTSKLCGYLQK